MKKTVFALLLATLLIFGSTAFAAMPDSLPEGETMSIDLNGDGVEETLSWRFVKDEYDDGTTFIDVKDGENVVTLQAEPGFNVAVYALTLPGESNPQILVTGDVMSDDYVTQCLFYKDGAIYDRLFPDIGRGDLVNPYYMPYVADGYGQLVDIADDGTLTLVGTQDLLGTYPMRRCVKLSPSGRFETNDDGIWRRDTTELDYGMLTLKQPMPVVLTDENGTETETALAKGTRLWITATDKISYFWFVTEDGREGRAEFLPNDESWGITINDIPEDDYFDNIPYAD